MVAATRCRSCLPQGLIVTHTLKKSPWSDIFLQFKWIMTVTATDHVSQIIEAECLNSLLAVK